MNCSHNYGIHHLCPNPDHHEKDTMSIKPGNGAAGLEEANEICYRKKKSRGDPSFFSFCYAKTHRSGGGFVLALDYSLIAASL